LSYSNRISSLRICSVQVTGLSILVALVYLQGHRNVDNIRGRIEAVISNHINSVHLEYRCFLNLNTNNTFDRMECLKRHWGNA